MQTDLEYLFVAKHYNKYLRTIIFSTSLDKIEVTEIGLKSEDSFGCATLGTGVMIAFFHATGGSNSQTKIHKVTYNRSYLDCTLLIEPIRDVIRTRRSLLYLTQ